MNVEALTFTELLSAIRAQLEPGIADELTFYASDEPLIFYASAAAKVSTGTLVLPDHLVKFLAHGLRHTTASDDEESVPTA